MTWVDIGQANDVTALTYLGGLVAATADNRLWLRPPVPSNVTWVHVGEANSVKAMAAMPVRGVEWLYALDRSDFIWARPAVSVGIPWRPVGAVGASAVALAVAPTGPDLRLWCLFAGSGEILSIGLPTPSRTGAFTGVVSWASGGRRADDMLVMTSIPGGSYLWGVTGSRDVWRKVPSATTWTSITGITGPTPHNVTGLAALAGHDFTILFVTTREDRLWMAEGPPP
ncbi:MAG: hypothetical protein L0Y54_03370 [Sporichthyaceae bacterium]|nr:hypothetical protein [Sporichthyaceae bacterium]